MKNKSIVAITLIALASFSTMHLLAYSNKRSQKTVQTIRPSSQKTIQSKTKKPEYYRPGQSDGLQNYPGKTIDAGMNTKMLPTNSASHMGNDITF
jgi:hypothetical protein